MITLAEFQEIPHQDARWNIAARQQYYLRQRNKRLGYMHNGDRRQYHLRLRNGHERLYHAFNARMFTTQVERNAEWRKCDGTMELPTGSMGRK